MRYETIVGRRPHINGVGGPVFTLLRGLMGSSGQVLSFTVCPLTSLVFIPLTFVFPAITALLILRSIELKKDIAAVPFVDRIKSNFVKLLLTQVLYFFAVYAAYSVIAWRGEQLLAEYETAARANKVLQIATAEQLAYSSSLLQLICVAAVIMLLVIVFIFTYSMRLFEESALPSADKITSGKESGALYYAFRAFLYNLPGYLVQIAILIFVFTVIERYFALYKLKYLEAYILKKEAFDPAWPFMILRLYVFNAFIVAFNFMAAMSLHIYTPEFIKKQHIYN